MIKRLDNVKIGIKDGENTLLKIAERSLGRKPKYFKIIKKSLDARDKGKIFWVYSIAFSADEEIESDTPIERISTNAKVAIIGSGPAGLMCALRLIDCGFAPIIIERGECVEERKQTTNTFFTKKIININSNIQFGEGGAGTFSDGKLNTQTKDSLNRDVLKTFVRFGAPEEILYLNKPHIGSDKLFYVLKNMRRYILDNGGQVLFNSKLVDFESRDGYITAIKIINVKNGEDSLIVVDDVVLAIGHSARDTFEMLHKNGVYMTAKEFAIGVRIEHLSKHINFSQYGKNYNLLPTADYKLVSKAAERTVFTFCMCPGGVVIPAASQSGGVVTNGMSNYARDGVNSNSALMVQMHKEDFGADDLFAGMRFLECIERRAFEIGGRNYKAPIQRYSDFAQNKNSSYFGEVEPTYAIGTTFAPLDEVLPSIVCNSLRLAIPDMDKRLKGFAFADSLLTGVETRFSSPFKIERDQSCQSVSIKGLYPCGEGSGYSGGITSSAADGLKIAHVLYEKYAKNH